MTRRGDYKDFRVFQQLPPKEVKDEDGEVECFTNFKVVGKVSAYSGSHAIDLAKEWPVFKKAPKDTLMRFPIVQRIVMKGQEVPA